MRRIVVVLGLVLAAVGAAPAAAAEPLSRAEARDTVAEIQAAVAAEPSAPDAIASEAASAPDVGSEALSLAGGAELELPASGEGQTVGGTTVYDAVRTDEAQIAVQDIGVGTRALINIDSAAAPERYEFEVGGDVARLQLNEDGSVAAFDAAGELVGGFEAPWARDAAGRSVPTRYEVEGTTLTQVVEHREGAYEYGVTADPVWLGLAIRACMAVRCYQWMPGYMQRQFLYGHMSSAVTAWLKGWFCAKTFIC